MSVIQGTVAASDWIGQSVYDYLYGDPLPATPDTAPPPTVTDGAGIFSSMIGGLWSVGESAIETASTWGQNAVDGVGELVSIPMETGSNIFSVPGRIVDSVSSGLNQAVDWFGDKTAGVIDYARDIAGDVFGSGLLLLVVVGGILFVWMSSDGFQPLIDSLPLPRSR